MADGDGFGREARGERARDLVRRRGTGEPGLDSGRESLNVPFGQQQPGVGETPAAGDATGAAASFLTSTWIMSPGRACS